MFEPERWLSVPLQPSIDDSLPNPSDHVQFGRMGMNPVDRITAWSSKSSYLVNEYRPIRSSLIMGFAVVLGGLAIGFAGFDHELIRVTLAVMIAATLALVSLRSPRAAVLLTLSFLPGLAVLRRILIPVAGWSSYDGLLLIAPIISIVVAHRLLAMERRSMAKDVLSKLVLMLVVIALVEVLNPRGGGPRAGLVGLLFMAAPLIWFFVGRELADARLVRALAVVVMVAGAVTAIYGLFQQQIGFPSWDVGWIAVSGYAALSVGGATRAFGTFSSSAEYVTFVAAALVLTALALLAGRRRRLLALPVVPLLAYAVFLESSRGIIVLFLLAIVIVLGLRTGSIALTGLCLVAAIAAALVLVHFLGPQFTEMAKRSGNPFVAHQVAGLMNPFDPEQSTYLVHQQSVINGVATSIDSPLGLGTAATNLGGLKVGVTTAGTEVDLTNVFVSYGLLGGLVYSAIIGITLFRAAGLALSSRRTEALAALGILILMLGQWLNGGYYALAPLVWLLVGWVNHDWLARRAIEGAGRQYDLGIDPAWGHERLSAG